MTISQSRFCFFVLSLIILTQDLRFLESQENSSVPMVPFSVDFTVSNQEVTVGEILKVTLTATHPHHYQLDVKSLESNLLRFSALQPAPFKLKSTNVEPPLIPNPENKDIFELRESSRDLTFEIDPILQYGVDFERSNPEALTRSNMSLFSGFGINNLTALEERQVIHFSLEPLYPGHFILSFWKVTFQPQSSEDAMVTLPSPLLEVYVKPIIEPKAPDPQPLLTLTSPTFPMEMDAFNLNRRLELEPLAAQVNEEKIVQSSIPWGEIVLFLLVVLFFLLSKVRNRYN